MAKFIVFILSQRQYDQYCPIILTSVDNVIVIFLLGKEGIKCDSLECDAFHVHLHTTYFGT